jgi:hypothetical protein
MARFLCWFFVLLLLGAFTAVGVNLMRDRTAVGVGLPAYSVYSQAENGLGEAAYVLQRLGWRPVALTRPLDASRLQGLLLVVEPVRRRLFPGDEGALSENDAAALLRWVEQGNALLLMDRKNTALHRLLGVTVAHEGGKEEGFLPVDLGAAGAYTEGIVHLSVGTRATLRTNEGLPLWWLGDQPGAVVLRRGRGRVLVVADPRLLTHEGLVDAEGEPRDDNVLFLANVASVDARDGAVYFDEYHHGLRSGGGFWSYLGHHHEQATVVMIFLVAAVAGWRWSVRLGPAVPTPQTSSADAVEYASALARLYQRTGTRRLLARTLVRGFLGTLTRHLRLRRNALPAVILAAWRQHDAGPSLKRLENLLRGVGELRKGDVSEKQLLSCARTFDQFASGLETTRPARGGSSNTRSGSL